LKTIRTKFLSLLLALVTILSLLPTAAFAASNTGSGLKITTNQAYWSTRLLANGTPYSYRPPLVDGKLVYCMDSGLGYHYATPSYLNSFTWTSGTGADADAVLQSAVTNSGLSEMDAATVENVKWMMTYLNDCKESNVGQLFMAVQTYVWENQSYKGEPGGDGDAGGYANADTYELYLSLIDSLLAKKAAEDAEFQRQIEEYKAQGIEASIVEDESAKWAVFAISSNRKNQSFFNYYGPRKLVTGEPAPDQPEQPTGGTGKIVLKKTAGGTTTGLAGARFSIYFNGQIVGSDITNAQGEIYVEDAATGLWSFVETSAPDGYCVDPTPKSVYVDVTEGDREYTVAAINYEKPDMKIIKRDAMSGKPIAGAVFSVKSVTGSYSTSVTTGTDGSATLSAIPAGVYVVREESVPEPYIVTNTEQTVALRPGKTSEVTFVDYEKPGLEIVKKNIANGEPIEGVTYRIEQIDGSFSTSATTDNHGRIFLDSVPVGTFKVTEINVPSHVILCPIPQEVALKPGETSTVTFFNALKPSLEIRKVDSVTGDSVKGAKFQIWYASNHTDTGELNDLGVHYTDESGKIILPEVKDGWYKVTELEPASGYTIKEPATQECFISGGESKVLTFENMPLSAIIIRKVDSESGQPLEGAWFRIRYLGGTSGTGGTVVGEYKTSSNGTIVATGLKAGTYVCEEISAPDGYVITDAAETVYLSGKDQDVITLPFSSQLADAVREAVRDYHEGSMYKRDEAVRTFRRNLFPRWKPGLGNVLACCDIFQIILEAAYEKYVSAANQNNQNYQEIARLGYVSKAYLVLAAIGTSGGALNLLAQMLINQANQYEADQRISFFRRHPDIDTFVQQHAAPYGWPLNDNYALAYRVLQSVCGIQRGSQPYSHMKKAELVLKGYVSESSSTQLTSLNIAINGGLAMGHYWKGRLLLEQAKQDHDRCNDYKDAAIASFCATNVTERFDHLPENADEDAAPQLSPPQWLSAIELLRYPDRAVFRVDRRMVFQTIYQKLTQQVEEVQSDNIQIHNERYRLTKKDVRSNLERCLDMVKAQFPDKEPLIQKMIRSIR